MNLPKRFTIELTNRCNRACQGCPRHKTTYPLGNMNWQLFTKIIGELPRETILVPFFRGESLLHPQFADAMKQLEKFKTVQLATNGDMLDKNHQKAILQTCSFVSVSLHQFQTKPSDGNLNKLLHAAKKEGVTTQISILETLLPEAERQRFIDSWLRYADRVRIYVEHSHNGYGDTNLDLSDGGQPCFKPFTDMVSYWDGKVALCNHDWNTTESLGDLNIQSTGEVWVSQAYEGIRHMQQSGNRKKIKACRDCHHWATEYQPNGILGELYTNESKNNRRIGTGT